MTFICEASAEIREKVIMLLAADAGLNAGEIARLTWSMVLDSNHMIGRIIRLPSSSQKVVGHIMPISVKLRQSLTWLYMTQGRRKTGYVAALHKAPFTVSDIMEKLELLLPTSTT